MDNKYTKHFELAFVISDLIDKTMKEYGFSYEEAIDILAMAFDCLKNIRLDYIITEQVDKAIEKVTNKDS